MWQEAKELIKTVYKTTAKFPKDEEYGIVSQMRRASISIAANIAEGWGSHSSDKHFAQYINISSGSLAEIECYVEICADLGFLQSSSRKILDEQIGRTGYLLNRFRNKLKQHP
ncbi:four helix bundle protein [Elusimicrobiota bacterium]